MLSYLCIGTLIGLVAVFVWAAVPRLRLARVAVRRQNYEYLESGR